MKKIFTKFFALIGLMLIGGGNSAWAETVTVTVVSKAWSYSSAGVVSVSTAEGGFQNAKNSDPAYGKVTKANGITISSEYTITAIKVTANSGYFPEITAGEGTDSRDGLDYSWSGSTTSVQLKPASDWRVNTIVVTYTKNGAAKLDSPNISATQSGTVTISGDSKASKICYTTDGSNPTSSSTEYTGSFDVDDATTVKAVCVGDGVNTSNSQVASLVVYKSGITVANPVITSINGVVNIACSTPNATIQYSTDNVNFYNFNRVFTVSESCTVYAKATRANCTTSEVTSQVVSVLPSVNGVSTVYLSYGAFDEPAAVNGYNTLVGKEGNDAYGWSIALTGNSSKAYSKGSLDDASKITTPSGALTSIKLSNGAANTLNIPAGKAVTKLTFYSFINAAGPARTSYWSTVGSTDLNNMPMGAYNNAADCYTTPDVRSYTFDNATGSIEFTNTGEQLCFVIAVEYVDVLEAEVTEAGYATLCSAYDVAIPDGVTAYIAKDNGTSVDLEEVENVIPANEGVIIKAAANSYTFKATTEAADDIVGNSLVGTLVAKNLSEGDYVLGNGSNGVGFYHLNAQSQIGANKAYLPAAAGARVRNFIGFGEVTGINDVNVNAVAAPAKRIVNGKLVIEKAGKMFNAAGAQIK